MQPQIPNEQQKDAEKANQPFADLPQVTMPPKGNDLATNDGAVVETLDTAFHNKPGWVEGENLSGSDRADYYEARSAGKTDAEEEVDALKQKRPEPE